MLIRIRNIIQFGHWKTEKIATTAPRPAREARRTCKCRARVSAHESRLDSEGRMGARDPRCAWHFAVATRRARGHLARNCPANGARGRASSHHACESRSARAGDGLPGGICDPAEGRHAAGRARAPGDHPRRGAAERKTGIIGARQCASTGTRATQGTAGRKTSAWEPSQTLAGQLTTPSARKVPNSEAVTPSSCCSTASVCWPRSGGGSRYSSLLRE